jgi:hypothetical protein
MKMEMYHQSKPVKNKADGDMGEQEEAAPLWR